MNITTPGSAAERAEVHRRLDELDTSLIAETALRNGDLRLPIPDDATLLISLHKVRWALIDYARDRRLESKRWLREHGYRGMFPVTADDPALSDDDWLPGDK